MSLDLYAELAKELCETRSVAKQMFWKHVYQVAHHNATFTGIDKNIVESVVKRVAASGCPHCQKLADHFKAENHRMACMKIHAEASSD